MDTAFDPKEFRKALGTFTTGVTIITTRAADGTNLGLTVNSFNSVSLNPPLVLWSLENASLSLAAFREAKHWAVHVLASDQEELSGRFARRGANKFAGLALDTGAGGIPLLTGCSARFQCRNAFQYDGGDHVIFVGEVLHFDRSDAPALVFHAGRYAHATQRDPQAGAPRRAFLAGSFSEDFLGYLLGRGHFQFFSQIRPYLVQEQLGDEDFYVLSSMTLKPMMTGSDLDAATSGILQGRALAVAQRLAGRGLLREAPVVAEASDIEFELTEAGRGCVLRLISAAKAVESQLIEKLGAGDAQVLKSLLNRMLNVLDPAASALWGQRSADGKAPVAPTVTDWGSE